MSAKLRNIPAVVIVFAAVIAVATGMVGYAMIAKSRSGTVPASVVQPDPMPTVCSALTGDENNCAPAPCDIGVTPVYRLKGGLNLTVIRKGTVLSLLVNNPDDETCKISGITGTFTKGDDFFAPPDDIITKEEVTGGYLYKIDYTKVDEKGLKKIKGSLKVTYKCAGDDKSTELPLIFTFDPTGDLTFVQG